MRNAIRLKINHYSLYRKFSPKNHNPGCTSSNLSVYDQKSPNSNIPISQNHKIHTRPLEKSWRPKLTQDSAVSILASGDCEVEEEEEEQEIKQKWVFFWECKKLVLYESHGLALVSGFVKLNNWWCKAKAATAIERYRDTESSCRRLPLSIYPNSCESGALISRSSNLGRV